MIFDWDEAKINHLARHGITPAEAEQVVKNDPVDLEEQDVDGEERFSQIGETNKGRILTVVATLRGNRIRVVTGWNSEAATKRKYLLQKGKQYGFLS